MIQETFPMIVGEEEVLNERELLVRVEKRIDDGLHRLRMLYHSALFRHTL